MHIAATLAGCYLIYLEKRVLAHQLAEPGRCLSLYVCVESFTGTI